MHSNKNTENRRKYADNAEAFIQFADIDNEAAKVLFGIQSRDYDFMNQAAFLCAQASEKYLKAYLIFEAYRAFPDSTFADIIRQLKSSGFGHNLKAIHVKCVELDKEFNDIQRNVNSVEPYTLLKYPDIEDDMIFSTTGLLISSSLVIETEEIGDLVKRKLAYR